MKETYYDSAKEHIKERYQTDWLGRYHGLREQYSENGTVLMRGHYKHNIPHGVFEHYRENGDLMSRETLEDGKLEGRSEHYSKGHLDTVYTYHQGIKEGPFEEYWNAGTLMKKGIYHDNLQEGLTKNIGKMVLCGKKICIVQIKKKALPANILRTER
ncbi:MAG: hypothetical protein IKS41_01410 [Alphaproteobacteria bacterium]|nr:hypothetical protein [Alphaproteobacteria bacterium]